jgi:hypothetical protein
MGEASGEINQILQDIDDWLLNDAEKRIGAFIRETVAPWKLRKQRAKAWFDAECHAARATTLKRFRQAREAPDREDLHQYMNSRTKYKLLSKEKKRLHGEEEERRIIQASENSPFQALTIRQPRFPQDIPMQTWVTYFIKMLNKREIAFEATKYHPILVFNLFTESKTSDIIAGRKNNKAAWPDGIYSEHLQISQPLLLTTWTIMFNKCMFLCTIPDGWRKSPIKILYKGKADLSDLDSYRRIAPECTPFKVFTRLLTQRLTILTNCQMPDLQFGFRTVQAVHNLLNDAEEALRLPGGKLFAVFVDIYKAFDMLNRAKLVAKLENIIGPDHAMTRILKDILAYNYVQIDNIDISRDITQTNGVLQGDPLSPLLFHIATIDAAQAILQGPRKTKLYIADDMVLVSKSKQELQEASNDLHEWSQENDFVINKKKTVRMVSTKGGKLAETDFICWNGERLKNVNSLQATHEGEGVCCPQDHA